MLVRRIRQLLCAAPLVILTFWVAAPSSAEAQNGRGFDRRAIQGQRNGRQPPRGAPELDPNAAAAAVALLFGGFALFGRSSARD